MSRTLNNNNSITAPLLLVVICSTIIGITTSFVIPVSTVSSTQLLSTVDSNDFSTFAQALEEEEEIYDADTISTSSTPMMKKETWQSKLESLLDPRTSIAKRQILASELAAANEDIRESVLTAVKDRKIDPLLTPTGKRLQDGTRAVARQLTSDIFPKVLSENDDISNDNNPLVPPPEEVLKALPKMGNRLFRTFQNQALKQFQELQDDLSDPFTKIPQRLSQQSQFVQTEVQNVFLETPEGLVGPTYTVVRQTEDYEIRDYESYRAASTSYNNQNDGAAFNALASYLFGSNSEERSMEMTTPVTTTSRGEMRFYLKPEVSSAFPEPLSEEDVEQKKKVTLMTIPASRLAVRRFTGFVTDGEVSRQKQVLLQSLELDGEELDVAHGAIVPHVIFQYNPPYTLPVVRRNEIAIPLMMMEEESESFAVNGFSSSTTVTTEEDIDEDGNYEDVSPSDY